MKNSLKQKEELNYLSFFNNSKLSWFTLVELLVVISILAIISVVAYQNFWWAVDKAVSGRKIQDVSTIEVSLQQFKVDNNYYPVVDILDTWTNKWWYDSTKIAKRSNTINVTLNWVEISTIDSADWWWKVINKDGSQQIWAKWTISQNTLWKRYLTKDLYDPEIWDIKETTNNKKLIEHWLWRYTYAVYRKPTWPDWWTDNKTWNYYNIAYTIQKEWSDTLVTKIVWDYDSESCFENANNCPDTLIGSWSWYLVDWQEQWKNIDGTSIINYWSSQEYQWIPYPVWDFE